MSSTTTQLTEHKRFGRKNTILSSLLSPPAAPSAVPGFVEHESNKLAQLARDMKVKTAVLRCEDDFITFIIAQPIEVDSTLL
jgi:hypothetical protein